jgi:hypothetical protein
VWETTFLTNLERPEFVKDLVVTPDQEPALAKKFIEGAPEVTDPDFQILGISNLSVVKGEVRSSHIVDPADGQLPYSEKGLKLALHSLQLDETGFDNPEERPTFERCLAGVGQAPIRPLGGFTIPMLIVQTGDSLVMAVEDVAALRVVHLDGRMPPPDALRSYEGYSAGRWEGDTLVVVTTHSRKDDPYRGLIGRPILVGPDSKVLERFTRLSATELLYEFTVEDPDLYAKPWRAEFSFALSDTHAYEYACHEANYSMVNMLLAGRLGKQPKPGEKKSD